MPLTSFQRATIIGLREDNISISEIARRLQISRPTVQLWVRRYKSSGKLEHYKPGPKGPKDTPAPERPKAVIAVHSTDPSVSTCPTATEHNESYNKGVSTCQTATEHYESDNEGVSTCQTATEHNESDNEGVSTCQTATEHNESDNEGVSTCQTATEHNESNNEGVSTCQTATEHNESDNEGVSTCQMATEHNESDNEGSESDTPLTMRPNILLRCEKCGVTSLENPSLSFHRFPPPAREGLEARVWAIYCYPDGDWSSEQSLQKLHMESKMLCSQHFDANSLKKPHNSRDACLIFTLRQFSIPTGARDILSRLRDEDTRREIGKTQVPGAQKDIVSTAVTECIVPKNVPKQYSNKMITNPSQSSSGPGIPKLPLCRVCLCDDANMCTIAGTLHSRFESLTRAKLETLDSRPKTICYYCYALLQMFDSFVDMSEKSEQFLLKNINRTNNQIIQMSREFRKYTFASNICTPQHVTQTSNQGNETGQKKNLVGVESDPFAELDPFATCDANVTSDSDEDEEFDAIPNESEQSDELINETGQRDVLPNKTEQSDFLLNDTELIQANKIEPTIEIEINTGDYNNSSFSLTHGPMLINNEPICKVLNNTTLQYANTIPESINAQENTTLKYTVHVLPPNLFVNDQLLSSDKSVVDISNVRSYDVMFECNHCGILFKSNVDLKVHQEEMHNSFAMNQIKMIHGEESLSNHEEIVSDSTITHKRGKRKCEIEKHPIQKIKYKPNENNMKTNMPDFETPSNSAKTLRKRASNNDIYKCFMCATLFDRSACSVFNINKHKLLATPWRCGACSFVTNKHCEARLHCHVRVKPVI